MQINNSYFTSITDHYQPPCPPFPPYPPPSLASHDHPAEITTPTPARCSLISRLVSPPGFPNDPARPDYLGGRCSAWLPGGWRGTRTTPCGGEQLVGGGKGELEGAAREELNPQGWVSRNYFYTGVCTLSIELSLAVPQRENNPSFSGI